MSTKVLIVGDREMCCQGLHALLEAEPGMDPVGVTVSGREAVEEAARVTPDAILLSAERIAAQELNTIRWLVAGLPTVHLVVIADRLDDPAMTAAKRAGAGAVLGRAAGPDVVMPALRGDGDGSDESPPPELGRRPLSSREQDVLALLADGRTTKQVAGELGLSVKTVETHRKHITEKLGLYSIAELTKYAIREGLTTLDIG